MVSKERTEELLSCWWLEQKDSWRDDSGESARWRECLTSEEQRLVTDWDQETPTELINQYLRRR